MEYKILKNIKSPQDLKELNIDELNLLSAEIRDYMIKIVSENGGHLSSNLGVVELSVALHKSFNSPYDKFVWDVGHQIYAHKLLTGRFEEFSTLRKENGISGFCAPNENEHDIFYSGHSSTSISAALGIAEANKMQGKKDYTVAVIGDGALTGGMAYEALNNAGRSKTRLIVVLNDNEMSIDCSVSPVSRYINHVAASERYRKFIDEMRHPLGRKFPLNRLFKKLFNKFEKGIRVLLDYDNIFTQMGFDYVGPIDGHNIEDLMCILRKVQKQLTKPVLLYVKTKKGRGYKPAEDDPVSYHGVAPKFYLLKEKKRSYTDVFSENPMLRDLTVYATAYVSY